MVLNLLLTDEIKAKMPVDIKIPFNYGRIQVVFPPEHGEDMLVMFGDNAVIEGEKAEIVKWLKPFDGIAVSTCGNPQFEQFGIMHIKEDL